MEGRGWINHYCCKRCGWYANTINMNAGVTPFTIRCRRQDETPDHDHMVTSEMYQLTPPHGTLAATHMFYRPTREDFEKIENLGARDHVVRGGLLFAELSTAAVLDDTNWFADDDDDDEANTAAFLARLQSYYEGEEPG